jgi:hypothetical protein
MICGVVGEKPSGVPYGLSQGVRISLTGVIAILRQLRVRFRGIDHRGGCHVRDSTRMGQPLSVVHE